MKDHLGIVGWDVGGMHGSNNAMIGIGLQNGALQKETSFQLSFKKRNTPEELAHGLTPYKSDNLRNGYKMS